MAHKSASCSCKCGGGPCKGGCGCSCGGCGTAGGIRTVHTNDPVTVISGGGGGHHRHGHKRTPCKKAFDDDFIRGIMTAIEQGVTAAGGAAAATALAALFCIDGCIQNNLEAPICGRAAILADNQFRQTILASLVQTNLVITRTVNPDGSVVVNIFRNAVVTFVQGLTPPLPTTPIKSFGVVQLVIDPSCCLRFKAFVDIALAPDAVP